MKKFLFLSLTIFSLQSFAFTSVTLKTEAKLVKNESNELVASIDESSGSDYCSISLRSTENADSLTLTAGTTFEVTSIGQNVCGNDWGRQCRLDLGAYNQAKGVSLYMVCKDRGLFASKFTELKVNKIAKNKISVK